MPRSFRGEAPRYPEPSAINEYKARSMIEEYRTLAIVFAILFLALAAYFVKSVLRAPKAPTPPTQSVYVDVVPAPTNSPQPAR